MNERWRPMDPERLIEEASVRGGVELSRISDSERAELWEWYQRSFASIPVEGRRIEMLEQFVIHGIADDAHVRAILPRLRFDERRTFGVFVATAVPGTAYARSFHACWPDLSEREQQAFTTQFSETEPARYVMIAPVTYARVPFQLLSANCSDRLSEVLDVLLTGEPIERVSRISGGASVYEHSRQKAGHALVDSMVASPSEIKLLLLPYADDLVRRGWLKRDFVRDLLKRLPYDFQKLMTQAEYDQLCRFHREYRHAHPSEHLPEDPAIHFIPSNAYRRRETALKFPAKRRAVRMIEDGYRLLNEPVSRVDLLKGMGDVGLPWTESAARLGMTATEVGEVVSLLGSDECDIDTFEVLRFSKHAFSTADALQVERVMLDVVLKSVREHRLFSAYANSIVRHFLSMASVTSTEGLREFLAMVSSRSPKTLLLSKAAIETASAMGVPYDVRAALTSAILEEPFYFLQDFELIWANVRATSQMTLEDVRALMTRSVRRDPTLLFDEGRKMSLGMLVPEENRVALVEELMREGRSDVPFLLKVLEVPSMSPLHAEARTRLLNPVLLKACLDELDFGRVAAVLGDARAYHLAMRMSDVEPPMRLRTWVSQYVRRNPSAATGWIGRLDALGSVHGLEELVTDFSDTPSVRIPARDALQRACERFPRDAFDRKVLLSLGNGVKPFLENHAVLAAQCNPMLLFESKIFSKGRLSELLFTYALGADAHNELLIQNRHAIAYDQYTAYIAGFRLVEKAPNLFVFKGLPRKNPDEFFQALTDRLSAHPFFDLYSDELQREIARERARVSGDDIPYPISNALWRTAMDVVLLSQSPSAVRYRDVIADLPSEERSSLLDALVTLVRYGRGEIEFDLGAAQGRAEAFAQMRAVLSRLTGLELPAGIERLPARTVRAQLSYYRKTARNNPVTAAAFVEYMNRVGSDSFETWRNWGMDAVGPSDRQAAIERLKSDGLVPSGIALEQYDAWVRPERLDVQELLAYSAREVTAGVRDIWSQAVADGHLTATSAKMGEEEVRSELEGLVLPLREWTTRAQELNARFATARMNRRAGVLEPEPTREEKDEHTELKERMRAYRLDHDRRIRMLTGLQYLNRMKHLTSNEIETRTLEVDAARVPWERAFKDIFGGVVAEEPEFGTVAERLRKLLDDAHSQLFGGGRISRQQLSLDDAIDPVALFHVGEQPVQSCQHWDGTPLYNVGLLSYQVDPNVRLIFLRDDTDRLIGRAALRLLEREDGSSALFIERVYSSNVHPKVKELFVHFARKKAAAVGVPLYTSSSEHASEEADQFNGTTRLRSRGSRAGFVYTDAGGGRAPNGVYVIDFAKDLSGSGVIGSST